VKHFHHTTGRYHKGCPACKVEQAAPKMAEALRDLITPLPGPLDAIEEAGNEAEWERKIEAARAALAEAGIEEK